MDTKSTKFNSRLIIKITAVILSLVTVFFTSKNIIDDLFILLNSDKNYFSYSEAFFDKDKNGIYSSVIFESEMSNYLLSLIDYTNNYIDMSEENFNSLKQADEKNLKKYEANFARNVYEVLSGSYDSDDDSYEKVFSFIGNGIVNLRLIESVKDNIEIDLEFFDFTDIETDVFNYCMNESKITNPNYETGVAQGKKQGADFVVTLPDISIYDDDNGYSHFKPGKYAVTVDKEYLKSILINSDKISGYSTYSDFKLSQKNHEINTNYKNINYIVTTATGSVITNVKDYKKGEIDSVNHNYYITGSNGVFTSNYGTTFSVATYQDSYGNETYIERYHLENKVPTTSVTSLSGTTYKSNQTNNSSENIDNSQKILVYFDDSAVFYNTQLSVMKEDYYNSGNYLRHLVKYAAICVAVYLAALVLLIALCGKSRKDDSEIHLLPTDKIFLEINLAIFVAVIFSMSYMALTVLNDYERISSGIALFGYRCLPFGVTLCAAVLMSFILYLVRITKAHKFLNSSIIYRLAKGTFKFIFKALKKLIATPVKNFIGLLKNVYQAKKAKNIKEVVVTKSVIIASINIVLLFIMLLFAYDGNGFMVLLNICIIALLDIYMILRSLKFVGGVDKLLEVLHAYRKGELETYINRAALPNYLIPAAEDLEQLGDGIKLAVDEAVKQETTKTELITNISHDLKTPLTSIINYVELLKQCDIQNETAMSYLEVLGEKSDRLKYLICDLVEASKAATGNIDVTIVDVSLKEIIAQITGEHIDSLDKKQLSVICDMPENDIIVKADSKLLYRVLENLIVNVNKYAMPATRVYISAEETDSMGTITIKNISAAPLNITPEQLKQRFVRGDASRTTEGNGLGLSIAENLCIVQDGKLEIEILGDLFIAKVELKKM